MLFDDFSKGRVPGYLTRRCDTENASWLVMVHGVSQDHRIFDQQVAFFKSDYDLMLIDLPGHGLSAGLTGPYGLAEFADHIDACFRAENLKGVHLWGTHLGASAGLVLASQEPDLFQSLVLESPVYPGRPLASVSDLLDDLRAALKSNGIDAARRVWWQRGPWFDAIRKDPEKRRAKQHLEIVDAFDGGPWADVGLIAKPLANIDDGLSALQLPIAIVNGEHDVPDFLNAAHELTRILPEPTRIHVPRAGGFPLWELPTETNLLIQRFMTGIARKKAITQPYKNS